MPRPARSALWKPLAFMLATLAALTVLAGQPARAGMLERAMEAVYVVRSADAADRFLGSAFRWGEGGEVAVTNAHVVGEAAEVRLVDRQGNALVAPVIARDTLRDVAVIGLPAGGPAGLVPGPTPELGAPVWALGAPLGLDFTATRGMVSAEARQVELAVPLRLLQHDAAVNPGSSGGPLVDAEGRVIGMNSRIADGSRHYIGIAYAIAAPDLTRIVAGLVEETLHPLPRLGLHLRPVTRQIAAALDLPAEGALVDRVEPGSLADRGGVMAGDVILAAGGHGLAGPGDLAFAVEVAQPEGVLALDLWREGAAVEVPLPLETTESALTYREIGTASRVAQYTLATLGITLGTDTEVTRVADASPAGLNGLAAGDRILSVNGHPATRDMLEALTLDTPALVLIARPGAGTRHLVLDPWDTSAGFRPQGGANVLDPSVAVF